MRVLAALLFLSTSVMAAEVPLEIQSGVYNIPVTINDVVTLSAILDSGAGELLIPADVAMILIRAGTISEDDILKSSTFVQADGTSAELERVNIKTITIGGQVFKDVPAAISSSASYILLGQSFLMRLTNWSIDNSTNTFKFDAKAESASTRTSAWRTVDETDTETVATTDACNIKYLKTLGHKFLLMKTIPVSRIKTYIAENGKTLDDYAFALVLEDTRAITMIGCWNPETHRAAMLRKVDKKLFEVDDFRVDNTWQRLK